MAASLMGGLIAKGEIPLDHIQFYDPDAEKAQELSRKFGIQAAKSNADLIANCEVIVIAVKPQILQRVLSPNAEDFQQHKPLIISVVAGITAASIEKWLSDQFAIIRVMPNTPALVSMGASGLYANGRVSEEQRALADSLCNSIGVSCWVKLESDIDTVTALSGSGPAYFMLFIQGLIEAAENAGMNSDSAKKLAVQTAAGAAHLISKSDLPLQTLIDNVTSPKGTTEKALEAFNSADLKSIVASAFEAARQRSEQLAKELG